MLEGNIKYFKDRVGDYEKFYFRDDEEYLVNKYFTKKNGEVLVLGCGAGRTLPPLFKKGLKITAIDIVPEMVAACKDKMRGLPINILEDDATDLKFSNEQFDYVFFPFHGIDCVSPHRYKSVMEAARVLKKDGIFIFNSHNRFFLKRLHKFFRGKTDDYHGAILYRTTPFEFFKLKKYFNKVNIKYRISMQKKEHSNWKDYCYKLMPFLSISIYFICFKPKKNYDNKN